MKKTLLICLMVVALLSCGMSCRDSASEEPEVSPVFEEEEVLLPEPELEPEPVEAEVDSVEETEDIVFTIEDAEPPIEDIEVMDVDAAPLEIDEPFLHDRAEFNYGVEPVAEYGDIYPMFFRVIAVERDDADYDLVSVETSMGFVFQFISYGSDWCVGDGCAAVMQDNGTPDTFLDDTIISVRYAAC